MQCTGNWEIRVLSADNDSLHGCSRVIANTTQLLFPLWHTTYEISFVAGPSIPPMQKLVYAFLSAQRKLTVLSEDNPNTWLLQCLCTDFLKEIRRNFNVTFLLCYLNLNFYFKYMSHVVWSVIYTFLETESFV